MELYRRDDGSWFASQENYTRDLLLRNLGPNPEEWGVRKVPLGKEEKFEEDVLEEKGEEEKTVASIRESQRIVGELIWLVTRCRPDVMFVVSQLASLSTRQPRRVQRMAPQVWKYLAATVTEGIHFPAGNPEEALLKVYTDASFGEEDSHGCVVIAWGGVPLLWKSSKQQLQSTSTAESELVEVMEGAVMMDALKVMIEEIQGERVQAWQYTDSSSALAIIVGETASWRTRHLRRRAKYLRWRVGRGDIVLRHTPGAKMIADLGTKALAAVKMNELKMMMGMMDQKDWMKAKERRLQTTHQDRRKSTEREISGGTGEVRRAIRLALAMAILAKAKGGEEEDRREEEVPMEFHQVVAIYTLMVMAVTLMGQWMIQNGFQAFHAPGSSAPQKSEPRVDVSPVEPGGEEDSDQDEEGPDGNDNDSLPSNFYDTPEPTPPSPEEVPFERSGLVVAGTGKRYHDSRWCQGMRNAARHYNVRVCRECLQRRAPWNPGRTTLYSVRPDEVMHTSLAHFRELYPGRPCLQYDQCRMCQPRHLNGD